MKETPYVWINCSCFYPMDGWHIMIKEFENIIENIDVIKNYDIEFNSEFGENIRLSFLVPQSHKMDVVSCIDNYMTEFFERNWYPSITSVPNSPNLPFPTSIIQFDLYQKTLTLDTDYQSKFISKSILYALPKDLVTLDTICACTCYLQVSLLIVCLQYAEGEIFKTCFTEPKDKSFKKVYKYLKDSEEYINSIFFELENDESLEKNHIWLADWRYVVNEQLLILLDNVPAERQSNIVKMFFLEYSNLISKKLNYSIIMTTFITNLLRSFILSLPSESTKQEKLIINNSQIN